MADTVREIERKYEADDDSRLPGLTGVAGVATVAERGVDALDATYYDTAGQRLAADGITLRRRTGGDDAGWHLKLPVEPGVRDEIRVPLGEAEKPDDPVPAELAGLVRSRVRTARLAPLVRLRTERTVRHLLDADGALIAELAVDRVGAQRLSPDGQGVGEQVRWAEVEVELADGGDPRVLDGIEARLVASGLRPASAPSKLARALAETEPGRPAKPDSKGNVRKSRAESKSRSKPKPKSASKSGSKSAKATAGDHVLAFLRTQVRAVIELDPAVRRDLPDSVHRMRVATRRLRSAFKSYGKVLDREATDPVGEELKWLAGELGVDRDREVLTERLRQRLAELPGTLLMGPVQSRLRIWSGVRRAGSREALITVLDSGRYLTLLDSLDRLVAAPPLLPAAAGPPRTVFPKAVLRDYRRLAGRVDAALAMEPGPERDLALHSARKAAKRARYSAEAARPVLGKPAKRFAKRMKAVQQVLGDHQDSVVARSTLREIAVQAYAAGENPFAFGVMYGREREQADLRELELPRTWRAASGRKLRSALG
ncbi:CYTH and CHAD domain-containing protein [Streptomyces sp. H27-D2]|uniref:CYTH and CHAD domain-containing protein n=1 Tax=Streptomyces sp. H27-D2 TaxID=3046304 RepID=UPI002DBA20E3|nr:CYTH and CHAD domain-containing protein [Streptomyces sp. H27-D2]MEC4014842.1 CYTH and CHAD domain-containing protein [Streptomyces sp. H27-D2]